MEKKAYIVVGNWKMHKTASDAEVYISSLCSKISNPSIDVYLAVPFTAIAKAHAAAKNSNLLVGAQNMSDALQGAFTGEISAPMLQEAGAGFVLLGHSERRHMFGESDELIHRKLMTALQEKIQPILCIGETLLERDSGRTEEVLQGQLDKALESISEQEALSLAIAYEPVWAIGTGKSATVEQVRQVHQFCRSCLERRFDEKIARLIPILYGGSVKADNVREIAALQDVNGVLVGGASLDPEGFAKIINQLTGI